ncbi:MAG: hypothetical protein IE933_03475 [Sphingomonadales bacterium]|nr:hypothetical protein [Sphingomonadales bacterium]MBD3772103.1 hypothetical protein [Paracoccaceae bacterium]
MSLLIALRKLARLLVRWIFDDWRNGPLLFFGIAFAIMVFHRAPQLEVERDAAVVGWEGEKLAHRATIENYQRAARIAQQKAEANVARVKAAQEKASQEIVDDYKARLAAARDRAARIERLRSASPAATDPGRTAAAGVPAAGAAPGRAGEAPGEDRLPSAGALTAADALLCTEQAIQLDALIDWVLAQAAIDTSPSEAHE